MSRNGDEQQSVPGTERTHGQFSAVLRNLEQAPFLVAILRGPTHVIEFANSQILRAWGKGREILGMHLLEAMPPLLDQPFIGYLDGVFRTGVSYDGREEAVRLQKGTNPELEQVYFNFVYSALRDTEGVIEGILVTAFEVTEHVRSRQLLELALEEARQERERAARLAAHLSTVTERLHAAQQAANIGIFDWNLPGEQVTWSPELYRLMGLKPGAIESTPEAWTEMTVPEDRERGWDAYRRAVAGHRDSMEVELRLTQAGGGARWVRISAQLEYDDAGAPKRVLGAVVDIQVLKAARTLALEEAERTQHVTDEILATMSNELRTPLESMLNWATALINDRDNPEQLERGLSVIEHSARTQSRLVTDLIEVSRIISRKQQLERQPTDATLVISAAIEAVRPQAQAHGVQMNIELDPNLGQLVADPRLLQQIAINLLSNAVKVTPAGGEISIEADRLKTTLVLSVEDTGPGIQSQDLATFFERFGREEPPGSRAHGGLGLTLVRHLTEAHGGTVSVNSAGLGRGATFTVSLPLTGSDDA